MRLFPKKHKHRWVVKEKEVLPSEVEQWTKMGHYSFTSWTPSAHNPVIVHYHCSSCGAEEVKRI